MKEKRILFFAIAFPIFFQIITYYGFQSSYTNYIKWNEEPAIYQKGIYGYRILSRDAVESIKIWYDHLLQGNTQNATVKYIQKKGTNYYHALFTFNTLFAVLASVMTHYFLQKKVFFPKLNREKRLGIIFFLSIILALSQYSLSHYDNLAIFLFLVTAFYSVRYLYYHIWYDYVMVCVLLFLSTLNRETACLNISFFATLLLPNLNKEYRKIKIFLKYILPLVICFISPYIILRSIIGEENKGGSYFFESITLVHNLTGINHIIGLLFGLTLLSFILFFASTKENIKLVKQFLLFSAPYILMIFVVGIFWEIRLFVPLLYGCTLLSVIDEKMLHCRGKLIFNKF